MSSKIPNSYGLSLDRVSVLTPLLRDSSVDEVGCFWTRLRSVDCGVVPGVKSESKVGLGSKLLHLLIPSLLNLMGSNVW